MGPDIASDTTLPAGGTRAGRIDPLSALMVLHGAASLLHFVHNAVFIGEYPNLPAWLSAAEVYAAWFGVASVGLAGYVLTRFGYAIAGLTTIAIYAALGLDGLAHYSRAPFSAHTWTMNLTIWSEAITAIVLLIAVANRFARRMRSLPR